MFCQFIDSVFGRCICSSTGAMFIAKNYDDENSSGGRHFVLVGSWMGLAVLVVGLVTSWEASPFCER